jgi:type III protein arginine methyltransferase
MKTLPLDEFLARAAENPHDLAQLSLVFFHMGNKARAREVAFQAIAAAPGDSEIRSLTAGVLSDGVPLWHFTIVRDAVRNGAYEAALKRAVTSKSNVLEVGTGTGILAMMAARAGAASVVTCEMVPAIADVARKIIAHNGFSDRVRVIAKKSYDLDPATDIGTRADLLVSEIISDGLLGEDVLSVIEHAAKTLLRPDAKFIPARGIVRVALAHDAGQPRLGMIDGFDLSPFNYLAVHPHSVRRGSRRLSLLSAPVDLLDFDFQSGGPFPPQAVAKALVSNGGEANGIAQWIALQMDSEGWYENNPMPGAQSAWAVLFWPFLASRYCRKGEVVEVRASHDRQRLRIWA